MAGYEFKFDPYAEDTFRWRFYEDDSEFDGNDFEYTFYLDAENAAKLRALMFADGQYRSTEEWMQANVRDQKFGHGFEKYCIDHDIHGVREVYEDYPGGINYYREF